MVAALQAPPESGNRHESSRSASFPTRFGPTRFGRNALSSFTVSPVPE